MRGVPPGGASAGSLPDSASGAPRGVRPRGSGGVRSLRCERLAFGSLSGPEAFPAQRWLDAVRLESCPGASGAFGAETPGQLFLRPGRTTAHKSLRGRPLMYIAKPTRGPRPRPGPARSWPWPPGQAERAVPESPDCAASLELYPASAPGIRLTTSDFRFHRFAAGNLAFPPRAAEPVRAPELTISTPHRRHQGGASPFDPAPAPQPPAISNRRAPPGRAARPAPERRAPRAPASPARGKSGDLVGRRRTRRDHIIPTSQTITVTSQFRVEQATQHANQSHDLCHISRHLPTYPYPSYFPHATQCQHCALPD